jgi:hypothetical protein
MIRSINKKQLYSKRVRERMDVLDWVRVDKDLLYFGKGYIDENFKHIEAIDVVCKTNLVTGKKIYYLIP